MEPLVNHTDYVYMILVVERLRPTQCTIFLV